MSGTAILIFSEIKARLFSNVVRVVGEEPRLNFRMTPADVLSDRDWSNRNGIVNYQESE